MHARAERVDVADNVVTRSEGKWRGLRVKAAAHKDVRVGNARGKILDAHLTGAGNRKGILDEFEDFRTALSGNDHTEILFCGHGSLQLTFQQRNPFPILGCKSYEEVNKQATVTLHFMPPEKRGRLVSD